MAQKIQQANPFGRLGESIGKALEEQAPKEFERHRLSTGLKSLGDRTDLNEMQKYAELLRYTDNPQIIQTFGEMSKRQARAQALSNTQTQQTPTKTNEFPSFNKTTTEQDAQYPSNTKGPLLEDIQEGNIPPTIEERDQIASKAYNANPAYFLNDPQKAIDWADAKIQQEEKRNLAKQAQHQTLTAIQDNVVKRLTDQSNRLNAKIPADLYSTIEDKAILATKPRKDGGRGLTEQAAIKEYAKEMDDASRIFGKIPQIGNWQIIQRPASETIRAIKDVQQQMEKIDQTDNFAQKLISDNKFSPPKAYSMAEPVYRVPELNRAVKSLPNLEPEHTLFESKVPPQVSVPKTLEIAPKLAQFVKDNPKASPLAIAYEIEKKGYDAQTWLQYLTDHAKELNLRQRQSDQTSTPMNVVPTMNDWWLSSFSGLE